MAWDFKPDGKLAEEGGDIPPIQQQRRRSADRAAQSFRSGKGEEGIACGIHRHADACLPYPTGRRAKGYNKACDQIAFGGKATRCSQQPVIANGGRCLGYDVEHAGAPTMQNTKMVHDIGQRWPRNHMRISVQQCDEFMGGRP